MKPYYQDKWVTIYQLEGLLSPAIIVKAKKLLIYLSAMANYILHKWTSLRLPLEAFGFVFIDTILKGKTQFSLSPFDSQEWEQYFNGIVSLLGCSHPIIIRLPPIRLPFALLLAISKLQSSTKLIMKQSWYILLDLAKTYKHKVSCVIAMCLWLWGNTPYAKPSICIHRTTKISLVYLIQHLNSTPMRLIIA